MGPEILEIGAGLMRSEYETSAYVAMQTVKFKVTKVEIDFAWLARYVDERISNAIEQEIQKVLAKLREYTDEQVLTVARGLLAAEATAMLSAEAIAMFSPEKPRPR